MLDVRTTAETRGDRLCERFDPLLALVGLEAFAPSPSLGPSVAS